MFYLPAVTRLRNKGIKDLTSQNLGCKTQHSSNHYETVRHALAQPNETNPKHYTVHVKCYKNLLLEGKFRVLELYSS